MLNKILVTSVRGYDFTAKDGKQVQGVKVAYVDLDCRLEGNTSIGYMSFEANLKNFENIKNVPGYYEPTFSTSISNGQRVEKLIDLKCLGGVDLLNGGK